MDMLCSIFLWVLSSSLKGSIIVLLVILIKKLFKNVIRARIHHILWVLVVIRLLMPFLPESNLSIFNMLKFNSLNILSGFEKNAASDIESFDKKISAQGESHQNSTQINSQKNYNKDFDNNQLMEDSSQGRNKNNLFKMNREKHSVPLKIASSLWFIGFLWVILFIARYSIKMKKSVNYFTKITDIKTIELLDRCKKTIDIHRHIPIYSGHHFKSPCIFGILNPRIYCPQNILENVDIHELFHIFLHELAHYKRRDLLWNFIGTLAISIHWFNPLIWISMKNMKIDRELACDAYVLEVIGEKEAISYGMTILESIKYSSLEKTPSNLLFFYDSNNHFERRIRMIKKFKKGSYKISAAALICCIIIGSITLTNAASPVNNEDFTGQEDSKDIASVENTLVHIEDKVIFQTNRKAYRDIKRVSTKVDFKFKVPDYIPGEYNSNLITLEMENSKVKTVRINYYTANTDISFSAALKTASLDEFSASIEGPKEIRIATYNEGGSDKEEVETISSNSKKEEFFAENTRVLKLTSNITHELKKIYYIWQNDEIQYTVLMHNSGNLILNEEMIKMISSLKYADELTNEAYTSNIEPMGIYDTKDLAEAIKALGFTPKMPLQLLDSHSAVSSSAYIGDTSEKGFFTIYKPQPNAKWFENIWFSQYKDKKVYEHIKTNGYIEIEIISGDIYKVKIEPLKIGSKEVYRTIKYQDEGELSLPDDPYMISYLWEEDNYYCHVKLGADKADQIKIIEALINEKPVNINTL